MSSYIDENTKNVGLGMIQGTSDAIPLTVDPITLELRVEIIPINSGGTSIGTQNIDIDENTHQVAAAVTDDSNEDIIPLTVNEIVGLPCLRVDVI